jgi:DNA-binding LytR/AlgR family response regulator
VTAAVRWRSAKSVSQSPQQRSGEDWIELPEAPLLKVRTSDMAVIRTARNYCELEVGGRSVLVRVTAKQLEHRLAPHGFVRVHRGAIVNLSRVRVVQRGRSGRLRLLLDDGSEIAVSKGHREVFTQRLTATTRTAFNEDWAA